MPPGAPLLGAIEAEFVAAQEAAQALQREMESVTHSAAALMAAQGRLAAMMQRLRASAATVEGEGTREAVDTGGNGRSGPLANHRDPCLASYCPARVTQTATGASEPDPAAEIERLRQQLAYKEMLLQMVRDDMARMQSLHSEASTLVHGAIDSGLDCESAPVQPAAAVVAVRGVEAAPVPRREFLIVDHGRLGADVARRLADGGHSAMVLGSELDVPQLIHDRQILGVAINLSMPDAWGVLRRLRLSAAGPRVPVLAYALPQNSDTGFWFGSLDFAVTSQDEAELIATLKGLAPNLKRVMAMSSDVDVMDYVRACLSAVHVSVSLVLDGRQVVDMLSIVRPEAAIVHLSPRCMDVFRAVAALRAQRDWCDVPILFYLDEVAQPRDVAFLTAGVRMLAARGDRKADEMLREISKKLLAPAPLGVSAHGSPTTPWPGHEPVRG